ncbi:MAG: hypothetical protein V1899_00400 [Planctomycetota bacterium]
MTDKQLKEKWLKALTAEPRTLVASIVETHRRTLPHLQIIMAVWLNAGADPWDEGVDLVEICKRLPGQPLGDMHPMEFAPQGGWPRLRVLLTDVQDLTADVEISGVPQSKAEQIRKTLADKGSQPLIFPEPQVSPEEDFHQLMNQVV